MWKFTNKSNSTKQELIEFKNFFFRHSHCVEIFPTVEMNIYKILKSSLAHSIFKYEREKFAHRKFFISRSRKKMENFSPHTLCWRKSTTACWWFLRVLYFYSGCWSLSKLHIYREWEEWRMRSFSVILFFYNKWWKHAYFLLFLCFRLESWEKFSFSYRNTYTLTNTHMWW